MYDSIIRTGYVRDFFFFFFNDTATTEIYTLSLHDALPICSFRRGPAKNRYRGTQRGFAMRIRAGFTLGYECPQPTPMLDRKSTRLNSSHANISYAVFCLKKKNTLS